MRKIVSFILSIFLLVTITSCAKKESVTKDTKSTEASIEKKKEEPKQKDINKGDLVKIDDYCEFEVKDTKFAKKVMPPKPEQFYTYYEAKEEGTTYLDTVINIKSLLGSAKGSGDFLSIKIIYDEKYEYNTFSTIEKSGGADFNYTNITSIEPLKNGVLHFLAEVPEEVEKDSKSLEAVITANKQKFRFKIR